jgi:hypothetical protein
MSEIENQYQPIVAEPAVTEEVIVVAEPEVAQAVAEVVPEPILEEEPKPKAKPKAEPVHVPHVIGAGDTDEVFFKQCVYKNTYARKSLTVHHLQRRLTELGYADANADRDGWYGDLTKLAVEQWQKDNGHEPTGILKADTFAAVFAGDKNVTVVLPE